MKYSLFLSIAFHVLVISAMVFLFNAVPRMKLPERVYSVKILEPFVGKPPAKESSDVESSEQKAKTEVKEPEKPKEVKQPAPKKEKEKKQPEKEKPKTPSEEPIEAKVGGMEGTGISVDAPIFPFSYYLAAIERKVSSNWFSAVSEGARDLTCVVYFKLQRDGSIAEATVEKSSGNAYFDGAALRAVRSSSPFPPLPRAFPDQYLGIHFTFTQKE